MLVANLFTDGSIFILTFPNYIKVRLKRYVLSAVLKVSTLFEQVTDVGSLLKSLGPPTLKLRRPYLVFTSGTVSFK